jgi:hypothetical protein
MACAPKFTDEQIKELIEKYLRKEVGRKSLQEYACVLPLCFMIVAELLPSFCPIILKPDIIEQGALGGKSVVRPC